MKKTMINKWRPVSELRPIEKDISNLGYKKHFADVHELAKDKYKVWSSMNNGTACFYEPLELKEENGELFYRENAETEFAEEIESFETQLGTVENHDCGEFDSWIEIQNEGKKLKIEGNYCDMFDCGEYVYAVSNFMHMGLGTFKITRIGRDYEATELFNNDWHALSDEYQGTRLEYVGRFNEEYGYILIASGQKKEEAPEERNVTFLFRFDENGDYCVYKELDFYMPACVSLIEQGENMYFGCNKMLIRLNAKTGELLYYTNKSDEEIAALEKQRLRK
jgi:hypothetical protein